MEGEVIKKKGEENGTRKILNGNSAHTDAHIIHFTHLYIRSFHNTEKIL